MNEIWKDVNGYEGLYQVSSLGRVRSFRKYKDGSILKQSLEDRYYRTTLYINDIRKRFLTHRLVADAFCENRNNYVEVNHIDGNKLNNYFENLEWVTRQENVQHAFRNNLISRVGEKNSFSKLTEDDVRTIRKLKGLFKTKIISCLFGVDQQTIRDAWNGKTWSHVKNN